MILRALLVVRLRESSTVTSPNVTVSSPATGWGGGGSRWDSSGHASGVAREARRGMGDVDDKVKKWSLDERASGAARDEPWTHEGRLEGVDVVLAHQAVDVDGMDGAPVHARASRLELELGGGRVDRESIRRSNPRRPRGRRTALPAVEVPSMAAPAVDRRSRRWSLCVSHPARGDDDSRTSKRAAPSVGSRLRADALGGVSPRRSRSVENVVEAVQRSDSARADEGVRRRFGAKTITTR